jgi:hypothetical protein
MKMLKISAFYLDKQKSFVPNAIFLDNFVSNESCGVQLVLCSGTHHSESMKFLRKNSRIGGFENLSFFESAILIFFSSFP